MAPTGKPQSSMDSLSCGWLFFTPAVTNCLRELGWGGHDIDRHDATYQGQRAQELRNRRLLIRLGVSGLLAKDDPGPSATKALTRCSDPSQALAERRLSCRPAPPPAARRQAARFRPSAGRQLRTLAKRRIASYRINHNSDYYC